MKRSMLTTVDNPFDPFTQFTPWFAWDEAAGYHTSGFLARLTLSSDELSEAEQNLANEIAIDEIVEENVTGMYVKVTREVAEEDVRIPI